MIDRVLVKYILSSGMITLLSFLYFGILNRYFDYTVAYCTTFGLGVLSQFISQHLLVFKKSMQLWKMPVMCLIYILQALVAYLFLYLGIEYVNLPELPAFVAATFLAFPVTYLLNKTLVQAR